MQSNLFEKSLHFNINCMKKIIIYSLNSLMLVMLSSTLLMAQGKKSFTLSGYVTDAKSGEKLIGASIFVDELETGTNTNAYGYYSIVLPEGNYNIVARFGGYKVEEESIALNKNIVKDFALIIITNKIEDVKVVGKKKVPIQNSTLTSVNTIPISQIKSLPAIFGEVDVLKALQLLPGVQGGTEGTSGIYVRGGSPDQNLFLLDGVPLYNVNHLGGLFSTFNANAISNVDLYKGGFPARFGGRLSSVIDVRMKEGNNKSHHGEASIGAISSNLVLEGPLKKNKGSYMISGRRTYIDALIAPIIYVQTAGNSSGGYYFYDLNTKLNYKLGKKDHLYLSGYFGKDDFYFSNKSAFTNGSFKTKGGINWGNLTGVLRWNHLFAPRIFGNLSATISNYNFNVGASTEEKNDTETTELSANFISGIRDYAIKYDVEINANKNHSIRAGSGVTFHKFTPSTQAIKFKTAGTSVIDTNLNENIILATEINVYAEDDWTITKKLKANLGLHLAGFKVQNNFYTGLQPRASMRYLVTKDYSIKASYARMNQFINLLAFDGIGLPTDLWVPVTDKIKPQYSDQYAIAFTGSPIKEYEVSIEGYYKNMQNVIDYKDGANILLNSKGYEEIVEMGRGLCYGSEFFIQKKEGRLQGMVSYGLAWSKRKYETINNGNWYYYKYDRRHDFKVAAIYQINKKWEISSAFLFNTGNWTTLPEANLYNWVPQYNSGNFSNYPYLANYFPTRNNFNMQNYHRLDVSAKHTRKWKKVDLTYTMGVYNIYGRRNPFFLFQDNDNSGNTVFRQFSLFGFPIPSLAINIKW
jgi:hypothetical protein